MSLPVRGLPVLQNWDCQGCSNCCREYQITITEEERQRILAQGWEQDPEIGGLPLIVRCGFWWDRQYRLNHRSDEACVFLSPSGRCRIHERFGAEAKPLACRIYPFILVPTADHWQVGLRFACPAASANKGRSVADHQADLAQYAAELERKTGITREKIATPRLQVGQRIEWEDLHHFVRALLGILQGPKGRMELRLRRCLALASLCRQARFDVVKGSRLAEFLRMLDMGLEPEVPAVTASLPPPSWVGTVLFRQGLAVYARKDRGPGRGLAVRGRSALLRAAWRFAIGKGPVPQIHGDLPMTTFEEMEKPRGPLPPEAEKVLERYYGVKVGSLQFFGPANFGLPFWDGFLSLALTFPMIRWLTRAFAHLPAEGAVTRAIGIVDHNFGFHPLLGGSRFRLSLRILARRGELERLIAWYSR